MVMDKISSDEFCKAFSDQPKEREGEGGLKLNTKSCFVIVATITLVTTIQQSILRNQTSTIPKSLSAKLTQTCPEYFRWIHQDLNRWKTSGISKKLVENGNQFADLRIVLVNGKLYVQKYREVYQTRDIFTVWGILQLIRLYPGRLPDFDLMFACGDAPVVGDTQYIGENVRMVPPVFHYCADNSSLDIVFPDWSFWGWPEVNVKPWNILKQKLEQGNKKTEWMDRKKSAFWKGNVHTSWKREKLLQCSNSSSSTTLKIQNMDWGNESQKGFKNSDLASQCTHRYKIYVEGISWSVSQKYILACDSMTLLVEPDYYDFFTRSLVPTVHYWPINKFCNCSSFNFAVNWGNNNPKKAQEIGKAGSKFIQEGLKMKNVYDYMFHLLNEYSKLLNYEPSVPEGAVEVSLESIASNADHFYAEFLNESMVDKHNHTITPCALPAPYHPQDLLDFLERKESLAKKVELWESSLPKGALFDD